MYGLNQRGDYFQDLCGRLFDYQERHGIIEPKAELFISVLLENEEIQQTLSRNSLNVAGLLTSLGMFATLQPHIDSREARLKEGKLHQARNPERFSLSSVYKQEAENMNGDDIAVRRNALQDYLSDRESEPVTRLIEECLMAMEEGMIGMTDINLLKQIISSPDYAELDFSLRHTLQMYGVSAETLSEDYRSPNVMPIPAVR